MASMENLLAAQSGIKPLSELILLTVVHPCQARYISNHVNAYAASHFYCSHTKDSVGFQYNAIFNHMRLFVCGMRAAPTLLIE